MKQLWTIGLILFNFALGIYAGAFFTYMYPTMHKQEQPLAEEVVQASISPFDHIKEANIDVYRDRIIINLPDLEKRKVSWSTYADTKSMTPTFGKGCNGLEFIPQSTNDIHLGDLVAFKKDETLIIHRVIELGNDEQGWFTITKGDNNKNDDGKIRFDDVRFVTFGIIC